MPWAHPRSRGENTQKWAGGGIVVGSSPLTRGKHADALSDYMLGGLIPAHAGKTESAGPRQPPKRAHPRSRGENRRRPRRRRSRRGSSPLTRGKHSRGLQATQPSGLIPAHAGKTRTEPPSLLIRRAHPRSRGENRETELFSKRHEGSSPLTRGKRGRHAWSVPTLGLIPAHAGKTARR